MSDPVALASRQKPKQVGVMQRPIVIVVSDGDGIPVEERHEITAAGEAAAKKGVRIHALAYSPTKARRSLLTLGELAKQSSGTFRWIQEIEGWPPSLLQMRQKPLNCFAGDLIPSGDGELYTTTKLVKGQEVEVEGRPQADTLSNNSKPTRTKNATAPQKPKKS